VRRSYTTVFDIAANTSQQLNQMVNPLDDRRVIHVKGFHVYPSTAEIHVGLYVMGSQKCDCYLSFFALGNGMCPVEFDKPANTSIYVCAQDDTGTGNTDTLVTLFYDVDTDL
jgi:hypothetical protein